MPALILTRFLYAKDEVELSLMMALLKNDDLQIIYYWAYELYYSGFDVFDLLLKIYLDYYYEKQPYFLAYIRKKQQLWTADGDMKHVAYVLRNMYNLEASNMVFMVRQYMANRRGEEKFNYRVCVTTYDDDWGPTILYKVRAGAGRRWVGGNRQYFLRALACLHMENVWYYLKVLLLGGDTDAVIELLQEALGIELDINDIHTTDINLRTHYIIAAIVRVLYTEDKDTAKKHIFVTPKKEHLDHIRSLEEEQISPVYDTLMHKRFVAIDKDIELFVLARDNLTDLVKETWFHWEYYAMGSPLWQNRLNKWGGVVNHRTKKIEFPTDEMQEAFYELYGYEFDELPKEVQAMSLELRSA